MRSSADLPNNPLSCHLFFFLLTFSSALLQQEGLSFCTSHTMQRPDCSGLLHAIDCCTTVLQHQPMSYLQKHSSCSFMRIGTMVFLCHDINDVFMEMAKLSKYARYENLANVLFAGFVLSWFASRMFYFPLWIIRSAWTEPITVSSCNCQDSKIKGSKPIAYTSC